MWSCYSRTKSNSPPHWQHHSIIAIHSHLLNEEHELWWRELLHEHISNHELGGDVLDCNASSIDKFPSIVILDVNMLSAQVSIRVLHECKSALIVTVIS